MYIAVEGCHGIGKTSICRELSKKYHYTFIEELKDNLLPPPKIGTNGDIFLSQCWFLRQMILKEAQMNNNGIYISDRGKSSIYIYSKANMNDYQLEIFKTILQKLDLKEPDLEIILHAPDEIIFDRIKKRGRTSWGEQDIDYVRKINNAFLQYYNDYRDVKNVCLVNASNDLIKNIENVKQIIDSYLAEL